MKLEELKEKDFKSPKIGEDVDLEMKQGRKELKELYKKQLNSYLEEFVKPRTPHKCIKCGEELTGDEGTFEWEGKAGKGYCENCGYPARGLHIVKIKDNEEIIDEVKFSLLYQYRPNVVKD